MFYLYKVSNLLLKDKLFSYLLVGFYAINFTHVFQLYFLGTFQEVALFTFINLSFYNFLKKRNIYSIFFFILALLSKETALFYLLLLVIYTIFIKKFDKRMIPYFLISFFFIFLFKSGLTNTENLDNYRIQLDLKLIINNSIWYFLWGLGVPNFTSNYFSSLLKPPIPEFYKMFKNFPEIKTYYQLLVIYYSLISVSLILYFTKSKNILKNLKILRNYLLIGIFGFFTFLGPVLFIRHRWMVRLTIPQIFTSLIQVAIIMFFVRSKNFFRLLGFILIGLYFIHQVYAIPIHESSSTFLLESRITKNALLYFRKKKNEIIKKQVIYFKDPKKGQSNPWGGSEKLKISLGDQSFIDHYFPNYRIKAVYNFENQTIPNNSYIIQSLDILLYK